MLLEEICKRNIKLSLKKKGKDITKTDELLKGKDKFKYIDLVQTAAVLE